MLRLFSLISRIRFRGKQPALYVAGCGALRGIGGCEVPMGSRSAWGSGTVVLWGFEVGSGRMPATAILNQSKGSSLWLEAMSRGLLWGIFFSAWQKNFISDQTVWQFHWNYSNKKPFKNKRLRVSWVEEHLTKTQGGLSATKEHLMDTLGGLPATEEHLMNTLRGLSATKEYLTNTWNFLLKFACIHSLQPDTAKPSADTWEPSADIAEPSADTAEPSTDTAEPSIVRYS